MLPPLHLPRPYARVYEPAEDSFLLLDTLSSPSETAFLSQHFSLSPTTTTTITTTLLSPTPLIAEIGPGSGVVLAFLTAHSQTLFSRRDILTLGIDVNRFACAATRETVRKAVAEDAAESGDGSGFALGVAQGDLTSPLRGGSVDVLVFNPPYVPTPDVPVVDRDVGSGVGVEGGKKTTFEEDSNLLALSYAGGRDGMEITERLIGELPGVLTGRQGWEKLEIVRIWRE
ncbi:S-adenosylmethionine-dependent methyltransferase [Collariella sp. IMI 366227]|nr:S-adenosylmethionine-dependent methyltransferase [Collariella sp. IMI 366227]